MSTGHFCFKIYVVAGTLRLVPRIQTTLNFWDKSLRLVSQKASCELFVGQVLATSSVVQTLQGTSRRDPLPPSCGVPTLMCRICTSRGEKHSKPRPQNRILEHLRASCENFGRAPPRHIYIGGPPGDILSQRVRFTSG